MNPVFVSLTFLDFFCETTYTVCIIVFRKKVFFTNPTENTLLHGPVRPALKSEKEIKINYFISQDYVEKINFDQQVCSCLEGQVVAIADEIAQRGHDVDDALTSGVMTVGELKDRLKITKCIELNEKIKNYTNKLF